jgi:uncharacterized protein (UPF0335 family)
MIENLTLQRAAAQQIDDIDGQIAALNADKKDIYDNLKNTLSPATNKAFRAAVKLRQKRRNPEIRDEMDAHEDLTQEILFALESPELKVVIKRGTEVAVDTRTPTRTEPFDPLTGEIQQSIPAETSPTSAGERDHLGPERQTTDAGAVSTAGHSVKSVEVAQPISELPPNLPLPVEAVATAAGDSLTDQPSKVVGEGGPSLAALELEIPAFLKRDKSAPKYEKHQYLGSG